MEGGSVFSLLSKDSQTSPFCACCDSGTREQVCAVSDPPDAVAHSEFGTVIQGWWLRSRGSRWRVSTSGQEGVLSPSSQFKLQSPDFFHPAVFEDSPSPRSSVRAALGWEEAGKLCAADISRTFSPDPTCLVCLAGICEAWLD